MRIINLTPQTTTAAPLNVTAAIVATHAAADEEHRELRLLAMCGDLNTLEAALLAEQATRTAERRVSRLHATGTLAAVTTLDLTPAIADGTPEHWERDADSVLHAAILQDLADADLL